MGLIANATLAHKGKVTGIVPTFLKLREVVHLGLTELIITKNMHERKLLMQNRSDAFITMPGGIGTMEELFELLTWLQLGLHSKPIGLLNVNHYYDDLIVMLQKMVEKGFLSKDNLKLLIVDDQIDTLLEKMRNFKAPQNPKWLTNERS